MASIESLLNPLPNPATSGSFPLPTPSPTISTSTTVMLRSPRPKKPRVAKDAPIFQRGRPRGEVRYPPYEERDEELTSLHRDFRIHPFGNIADYPRHIPYNSDKKSFQERTGRESFEVFQYTFQIPGEDRKWTVMWDYNIGLVRTTHLFKCNDYSKTTPAKMLNQNPGLRDVCHSITGGALAAQGYWMPYEAAKAVASTFCWKIRFALTPIFGVDFPSTCISPTDRTRFGRMIIDPSVVRTATQKADFYRFLELQISPPDSLRAKQPTRPSSAPGVDRERKSDKGKLGRHILPRQYQHHRSNTSTSTDISLAGYGSSPEMEYSSSGTEPYCVSPVSPVRRGFTPVNTPRSTDVYPPSRPSSSSADKLPSVRDFLASIYTGTTPRAWGSVKTRALDRARGRLIPSSVPPEYTSSPSTTRITSYPNTVRTATLVPDGSDIDADAETDVEFFDADTGYELQHNSSDETSTSSTASSGSGSSSDLGIDMSINASLNRLSSFCPRNSANNTPSPRDTDGDAEMLDFYDRTPKRTTVFGARKRDRRTYPYPYSNLQMRLTEQGRDERGTGRTLRPEKTEPDAPQAYAQDPSNTQDPDPGTMAAAHMLIQMRNGRVRSSSDVDGGRNRVGHGPAYSHDILADEGDVADHQYMHKPKNHTELNGEADSEEFQPARISSQTQAPPEAQAKPRFLSSFNPHTSSGKKRDRRASL